jgi:hypothetical protein
MSEINCHSCVYYSEHKDIGTGLCRRYPTYVSRIPTDVCGEWVEKPVEVEIEAPKPAPKTKGKK